MNEVLEWKKMMCEKMEFHDFVCTTSKGELIHRGSSCDGCLYDQEIEGEI